MPVYSQWHYLLGYAIVLTSHNWPIFLCVVCGLYYAYRIYRRPTPTDVRWLYGWAILGFAYEYHKHLGGVVAEAIDFLIVWQFWEWNWLAHQVALAATPLAILLALGMFWQAYRCRRQQHPRLDVQRA